MSPCVVQACRTVIAALGLVASSQGAVDLSQWKTTGPVSLDAAKPHLAGGTSLRLEPGASAVWSLRETSGAGRVSLWVYDDGTAPAAPKKAHVGPRWGIIQPDGRVLVVGVMYAPYLAGDTTYASSDSDQKSWFNVQYLATPREPRWRNWVFEFDAEKGLTLLVDGKANDRFNWNVTQALGFSGVALFGDTAGGDKPQTLWVGDVEVTLGGPMTAKPTPPPPPPPVVPEKDPALEGAPPKLRPEVMNVHPRLLFNGAELQQLKVRYESATGTMATVREKFLSYLAASYTLPTDKKFVTDATDGQRQGLWRMPTVALHYLLTADKKSFVAAVGYLKLLLETEHWEGGAELDSGMSSANIMAGAALVYDWLYNDLEPQFREQFRKKLWFMARAQYHGGHLMKNKDHHYWQNEPANNHRWHRDSGLALAVLTAYTGAAEEQWLLAKTFEELKFVADWLPADGTSHEGPGYEVFGAMHLTLAMDASDRCFGTDYLAGPFFRNICNLQVASGAPGPDLGFDYGDNGANNPIGGPYAWFLYRLSAKHRLVNVQAILDGERLKNLEAITAWAGLLWRDPTLTGGSAAAFPLTTFWPDVGWAVLRESRQEGTVGAAFKCGPWGGYRLNEYRNQNNFKYINVAHDHPNANAFQIICDNEYVAEMDRYPMNPGKLSTGHNTILINGIGQAVQGREEGLGFSQPSSGTDMTQMAKITAWKDAGDVVVVEGEAAGSYLAYTDAKTKKSRPALERCRRTFIWVKGGYILALDDIRAPQPVTITWLMQSGKVEPVDAAQGKYRLLKNQAQCDFQLLADTPVTTTMAVSTANEHDKLCGWQQLQVSTEAAATRFVGLFNPWHHQELKLTVAGETLTISGPGFTDKWHWQPAVGKFDASSLQGARQGGFEIVVDAKTAAPPAP